MYLLSQPHHLLFLHVLWRRLCLISWHETISWQTFLFVIKYHQKLDPLNVSPLTRIVTQFSWACVLFLPEWCKWKTDTTEERGWRSLLRREIYQENEKKHNRWWARVRVEKHKMIGKEANRYWLTIESDRKRISFSLKLNSHLIQTDRERRREKERKKEWNTRAKTIWCMKHANEVSPKYHPKSWLWFSSLQSVSGEMNLENTCDIHWKTEQRRRKKSAFRVIIFRHNQFKREETEAF